MSRKQGLDMEPGSREDTIIRSNAKPILPNTAYPHHVSNQAEGSAASSSDAGHENWLRWTDHDSEILDVETGAPPEPCATRGQEPSGCKEEGGSMLSVDLEEGSYRSFISTSSGSAIARSSSSRGGEDLQRSTKEETILVPPQLPPVNEEGSFLVPPRSNDDLTILVAPQGGASDHYDNTEGSIAVPPMGGNHINTEGSIAVAPMGNALANTEGSIAVAPMGSSKSYSGQVPSGIASAAPEDSVLSRPVESAIQEEILEAMRSPQEREGPRESGGSQMGRKVSRMVYGMYLLVFLVVVGVIVLAVVLATNSGSSNGNEISAAVVNTMAQETTPTISPTTSGLSDNTSSLNPPESSIGTEVPDVDILAPSSTPTEARGDTLEPTTSMPTIPPTTLPTASNTIIPIPVTSPIGLNTTGPGVESLIGSPATEAPSAIPTAETHDHVGEEMENDLDPDGVVDDLSGATNSTIGNATSDEEMTGTMLPYHNSPPITWDQSVDRPSQVNSSLPHRT